MYVLDIYTRHIHFQNFQRIFLYTCKTNEVSDIFDITIFKGLVKMFNVEWF